jgi:hypothetical protein
MAHSHKELLKKLLAQLQHPGVNVFVHIDRKSEELYDDLLQAKQVNLVKDRVDVKWAHLSQVKAVFSSYREIKKLGNQFDHLVVISGQDMPLRPIGELVEFLGKHKNKSFISHVPLTRDGWAGARKRFHYHYYVRMEKLWRALMMLTGIRRQFPFGLNPYGGAQWINISPTHMDHILHFCETHISFMRFMETVRFPEEMIFQTLLMNSPYKNDCVNEDLRFIKWLPGKSNPEVLTESNYNEIRAASVKFFARKFDMALSGELIDLLNREKV